MIRRQKLVTVFVHDKADGGKYGDPKANPLFGVTEHLENYFKDGWAVREFRPMGGAGGCMSGWIVVLLEK